MGVNDAALLDLQVARAALDRVFALLQPSGLVSTPEQLDQALAVEPFGHTILLSNTLRYPRLLTLDRSITLQGESSGTTRMDASAPLPTFLGGLRVTGDLIDLSDVEAQHTDPGSDIVVIGGRHVRLDRVRVLGHPINGGKRGIAANGEDVSIQRSYIDRIFRVGQDTQAIGAWDMGPGLEIADCYLAAAGQSVMFGGADSSSEVRIPRGITIDSCTLTKDRTWFANGSQIKCALEFKSCIGVRVDNCVLEYAGIAQGQGAYLIVATPRNQDGNAPWSSVRNVEITNCRGGFAGGVMNMLGTDYNFPSGPLDKLRMTGCAFHDIDPKGLTAGDGRLFMFTAAPRNVTIQDVTVTGQNIRASGYFVGLPPVALTMGRLTLPTSTYGWKIDGGGQGVAALRAYAPDAVLELTA